MGALAKAQGSYKTLIANQDAPGGKYANLKAILSAVNESLSINGLAFYQYTELLDEGSGAEILKTLIGHESGQYISSFARILVGNNERTNGNIYEIKKRRQALMILGIAPSDNDPLNFDDNGEEIAEQKLIQDIRKNVGVPKPTVDRTDVVSKDQYEELCIELEGQEDLARDIMETHDIRTLADLPRSEYHKARNKIMRIKRTQEDYERNRRKD
jgi:hypothetical protein